jgi:hypothetical protein
VTLILITVQVRGQNLVPNPSFEDVNICTEIKQPCSPSGWFYINHKPKGYHGRSKLSSAHGDKHLSLLVIDPNTRHRDYWQTQLLCSLKAGETYKVSVKVTSESRTFNLGNIGFHFSSAFIKTTEDTVLQPEQYLSFIDAKIKRRGKRWNEVEVDFTPLHNFTHLIIGNFSKKSNQELSIENKLTSRWSLIAIDDVVISSKSKVGCEGMSAMKDSLYGIKSRHSVKPTAKKGVIDTIVINNIEFDFDSAVIKNEDTLKYLKPYLMDPTIKWLRVVGYTDISGTVEYNNSLSLRRATSVSKYLKEKLKIAVPIEIEGRGISYKYIEPHLNRRVEIWIYR